jgi:hypothetical protein
VRVVVALFLLGLAGLAAVLGGADPNRSRLDKGGAARSLSPTVPVSLDLVPAAGVSNDPRTSARTELQRALLPPAAGPETVTVSARLVGPWPGFGCSVLLWPEEVKGRPRRAPESFPVRGDRLLLSLPVDPGTRWIAVRVEVQGGLRVEARARRPAGATTVSLGDLELFEHGRLDGLVRTDSVLRPDDWSVTAISREPAPVGTEDHTTSARIDESGRFHFPRLRSGRTLVRLVNRRLGTVLEQETEVPPDDEGRIELLLPG